jgi:type I restriction enzyme S subunit
MNLSSPPSSGWQKVPFGEIVRNVDESVRDPQSCGLERYVGLEHIDPESLHIQRWGLIADGTSFTRRFRKGQVLFGKRRAYQRKVAVAEFDGLCSSDILVFEPKDDCLLPELLPFICQSDGFFEHALDTSAGSLSPRTKFKELARYESSLPPLDEQHRIAEILWAADKISQKYINLEFYLTQLKHSLWSNLSLGADFKKAMLCDIGSIFTGSTPTRSRSDYWENGTIPWLTTEKVNDRFIRSADEFITENAFNDFSLKMHIPESTLVALYGEGKTRGTAALLMTPASTNQAFACITPNEKIDPWFLFYCLDNSYEKLRSLSQGSNQKNLSAKLLSQFEIPLPPIQKQKMISSEIKAIDDAIVNCQNVLQSHKLMTKEILNKYFTFA